MRVPGARHRDGATTIAEAVPGLVRDGIARGLLGEIGPVAASLHDETVDDAMENGSVVETRAYVLEEVLHRDRSAHCIELEHENTLARLHADFGGWSHVGRRCDAAARRESRDETGESSAHGTHSSIIRQGRRS